MKFVDEYRDPGAVRALVGALHAATTRPWTIMEICGGQTHAIVKYGLDTLIPRDITLVHGPGCPVCVTPVELIDRAVAIASQPGVLFTSFGDMLRVPGSSTDLLGVKARGGDVRIVYSPLDALQLALQQPSRQVVFFAVGFETTAPANAMAVVQAHRQGVKNFSVLNAHVRVPPAIRAILSSPTNRVQGFLAAGHVCTVMGFEEYLPLAETYHTPMVITGFEPVDILQGITMAVSQLESGRAEVENQYARMVRREGNPAARAVIDEVFEIADRNWRGIGLIPNSGYRIRERYRAFDAEERFAVGHIEARESPLCIAGSVLQGLRKPHECTAFGRECTPEFPLGAPMVSSEGACAAYYRYGKLAHG
ncbi:MAG TPA: hydrogenase formation protein HypD [Bacteroidota bacterium]|nr:hydrogenase formation protein HypD [Bacteroidota bacterium]